MRHFITGLTRTVYCILPFFICILFLSACGSGEDTINTDDDNTPLIEKEVTFYVYPGIENSDGVIPRMTIVNGDELCTEYYDPTQPEVYVFHYMNTSTGISEFMTASSKGLTIMEDNPFNPVSTPNVVLITRERQDVAVSAGTYSKSDKTFNITSVKHIENTAVSKVKTRSDDMDFARELVMKDIICPLSEYIGKLKKVMGDNPVFDGAKNVLDVWSDVGLVVAEAQLYSNDEKEFQQLMGEKIYNDQIENVKKKIKYITYVDDKINPANQIYRAALSAYRYARDFDKNNYEDVSEEFVFTTTDSYSFTSRQVQESVWKVYDDSQLYKPTVRLVSVKNQSASVRGSFSNYDGRFTVTGYYLYHNGVEIAKVSAALDGSTYTFNNLEKGESYSATAFVTVMGATYESSPVSFRIEGDLELSAYDLTFSDVGGKTNVQVTLPSDEWTWEATCNAKWCKIKSLKDNSFDVEVSSSSESRESVITVIATSPEGVTQTKTINVLQKTIGNFAFFKGKCILIHKCTYPSDSSYNFTQETSIDASLLMTKIGNDVNLTFALPVSGLIFSNWKVSNERPTGTMLAEGFSIVNFNCSFGSTQINIDGNTKGPDNSKNEFSVRINLRSLTVEILESGKSEGIGYPGMSKPSPYKAQKNLSGKLYYSEDFNI